ncbi:ABC transporter ATP-binding protein [uncultured Jannaschia sp.]|uniref:ABC transporter ATP-binding protein n=1 Tax=uncultured Jannaschia sp. TaxID=293347 RepID=UPI00260B5373|nr:ABC transporter ATP-binding protein [uncultured Jannaschia sp.]
MAEPVLEARGLTKRFGALVASRDVSLDLRPGEIHAVIGPNGAGKSTLIAQLCGQIAPDAGTVRLDGADVTAWSIEARARAGIARTFQVSALAGEDSVRDNVLLAAMRGTRPALWRAVRGDAVLRDRAEAALARAGLDRPDARVSDISHGQRRQLEVAMALAQGPRAFVMDEPMAGLGGEGTRRLTGLLDGLRAEAPILLVEHDMDAVFALADRVSVMVEGAVIATGTVAEVRADRAVRDAYLGADA